ncbi:MAG: hypothetical protein H7X77_02685, partial [Anaerolineae bacterium]|nr:hypothetical protein [Anaerolineae bacterium]
MKQLVALLLALVMSSVMIVDAQDTGAGAENVEEATVRGTVIQNIQGVAVDAHNELLLATEAGTVQVLVMEGGHVIPEMAAQQCNKNQAANEASWNLKPGDVVEVFGRVVAEGEMEVCSDVRYSVTLLETTIRGEFVGNIQDVVDDA